jgi:hypothetical protein
MVEMLLYVLKSVRSNISAYLLSKLEVEKKTIVIVNLNIKAFM